MNRATFFASLRRRNSGVFGTSLSQAQVDTLDAILDAMQGQPLPFLAYTMATAYHETGGKMYPVVESLNYTTPERIAAVWPSRFTVATARPFVRNPRALANKVYNGRLGNRVGSDDGWTFRGRGLDQLTGRDNYRAASALVGADLVAHPDAILEPSLAVASLVDGMIRGRYTGRRLSHYQAGDGFDYVNARAIVNADVRANGAKIATIAKSFEAALIEAGYSKRVTSPPATRPAPHVTEPPKIEHEGGFGGIIAAILRLFGRRK
jgi:putative chitinase